MLVIIIVLYCLIAAAIIVTLSMHQEFVEEGKRKRQKGSAQVISIESGRRPLGNLHKHA